MRQPVRRMIFFMSIGLLVSAPAYAAFVINRTATITRPSVALHPIVLKPQITQVKPHTCVHRGGSITILGSNFGGAKGRHVALIRHGASIGTITTKTWSATRITATVPKLSALKDGQQYDLAIAQNDKPGWLSNVAKGVTLCAAVHVSVSHLKPITATSKVSAAANTEAPTTDTGTYTEFGAETDTGTTPSLPSSGGSLLQSQFPPPPQDVPAPPPKEDDTIESHEVLVLSNNLQEAQALLAQAQSLGLGVKRRSVLKGLGFVVTVLRVPKQMSSGAALTRLRKAMPKVWADVNHRYTLQGRQANSYGRRLIGWRRLRHCPGSLRIGLLDSVVDKSVPALHRRAITQRSFLAAGIKPAPPNHATATAALLVAAPQASGLVGLIPQAHLYVANIFRVRDRNKIDTTAEWIVRALDWEVRQRVNIINLSLGGPRNLLVEAAVHRVLQRGVAIVAAAGNGGKSGPPVYPAAQPGVLAVTAVDARRYIYKYASHGNYIALSAPGVDIWTAAPGKQGEYVSGTSYAAPFVTAALASAHLARPRTSWSVLEHNLEKRARDLGKPGKDPIFGWGLVRMQACRLAKHRRH